MRLANLHDKLTGMFVPSWRPSGFWPGSDPYSRLMPPLPDQVRDPLRGAMRDALNWLPPDWPASARVAGIISLLFLAAWMLRVFLEFGLLQLRERVLRSDSPAWLDILLDRAVLRRSARIVSPLLVQLGLLSLPKPHGLATIILYTLLSAYVVLCIVRVILAYLDATLKHQTVFLRHSPRQQLSIKSYIQLAKLVVVLGGLIIMAAELTDRSPLLLLSGLGALSAVLMLVFKDTILSFTAGVQLSSNDMLRAGDWIEMPQVGADGQVVDMALHAVKVQNWDKTITTIPTWRLMSESYRNWRGMSESGARRIKRTLSLDATSVHFLQPEQIEQLERIELLRPYLQKKRQALADTNAARLQTLSPEAASLPLNLRQLTNLGCFRAYVSAYLEKHPDIRQDMTQIVNTAGTSPEGVQVQIYCFSATTNWQEYETIQGDLFDHLLSVLPEFGLRVFQQPSGHDFRTMMQGAAIPVTPTSAAPASPEAYPVDATHAMPAASVSEPVAPSSQAGADISDKR